MAVHLILFLLKNIVKLVIVLHLQIDGQLVLTKLGNAHVQMLLSI